jgi:hypothetical protein
MIPLNPALLVGAAHAFVGLGEEGGDNRGQMVELMLSEVHQPPGKPWCAAFVHHVGKCSHYDWESGLSSWPLPDTASCQELNDYAQRLGIRVSDAGFGDVFLKYSEKEGRYVHTGIVIAVLEELPVPKEGTLYKCMTIEGNTTNDGSTNGVTTLRRVRRFNTNVGDCFIRWVNLDARAKAA